MKKLYIPLLAVLLFSCGESEEKSVDELADELLEKWDDESEEAESEVSEITNEYFDKALGHWEYDLQANIDFKAETEEEKEMSELDKVVLLAVYKPFFLDLNEDGTYEFKTANADLCGPGVWNINDEGSVLTLDLDTTEPIDYEITLLDENKLQLNNLTDEYDYNFFLTKTLMADQ